ncbi:acyl-CoA synthetase (AMP-forming)/AMP-acid ligase II [Mycobacteroides chelonae]|nr:acyl-CoA synthetase (AMP-forming)/AMP-acid ligase II [Mycobacteroides chelonae]
MTLLSKSTLWDLVEKRSHLTPNEIFLRDEFGGSVTFREYRDESERTAAALAARGADASTTVAWQLPTWIKSVVLMSALARLGARQMPLLTMYRTAELVPLLDRARASLWILPTSWRNFDFTPLSHEVTTRNPAVTPVFYDELDNSCRTVELPPPPSSDTAVRWIFPTSGTTSEPQGVLHTDRSLLAGGAALNYAQKLTASDSLGIAFPIGHIGGANNLAAALQVGAQLVLHSQFDPADTAALFRRHRVTIACGGPSFYAGFLTAQRANPHRRVLPDLRFMTGGGAPMPPQMHVEVREEVGGRGCVHGYGMTEACIIAMNSPDDTDAHLESTVGRATPYVNVRIVDDTGNVCPPNVSGEIQVRGEAVSVGYLDSEIDATRHRNGWLLTGDIGTVDSDGYYRLVGRRKDIIIRKGENISATELEGLLYSHPKIADVAIIGLPDTERGELVCAVVAPVDGQEVTLSDITEHCERHGLMRQKTPERLEILNELPYGPTGKTQKEQLRARYGYR